MWRIWFFFGILEISFGAPVKTNQGGGAPSSELVVLKCLLSSPLNSCDDVKRTVEKIPKRIQKLYEKLKQPLRDVTKNEILDSDAMDMIPISLLYLIPKIRLLSMSGLTASNIVRKYPLDDALTMKILGILTYDSKIQDFLDGLSFNSDSILKTDYDSYEDDAPILDIPFISPAVEEEIGIALSKWFPNGSNWEFWLFQSTMMSGTPILANLPNYFLNDLPMRSTEKFLYHLRNWRWDQNYPSAYEEFTSSASVWTRHTMSVRRIWAHVVLTKAEEPGRWSSKILNQLGFLLTGATSDELKKLPPCLKMSRSYHILLKLDWSPLQARSVFDVLYSDLNELNGNDLNELKDLVVNLLPRQLQQFSGNSTNFEAIMKSDDKMSLATKKQIFEIQLAHKVLKNHTKGVKPEDWKHKLSSLGKFVHLVPASQLKSLENETYSSETLLKIDSTSLTHRQIRYLTKSGSAFNFKPLHEETLLSLRSFLKSIPSVNLVRVHSNKLLQHIKEHLLMFTSGDSPAAAAAVLHKVRSNFGNIAFMEKMLYNKDYSEYFNLLGSRDITRNSKDISSNLFILVKKDPYLERNIRLLPYNILFSLLSHHRQEVISRGESWTYENLIDSSMKMYISGLSCSDIKNLDLTDFMPIMGYYVRHRRALGQVFPKNLQHCSQDALMHYLKLKAQLRDISPYSIEPLRLLETYEVKAVGGYVMAGLPVESIIALPRKQQIISEIGKLSVPELLTASSLENTKILANSYYVEPIRLQLKSINALGNLVWFLKDENIRRLEINDFKLFLESQEENSHKALCLNERERNSWRLFLIDVFGNPETWSSGTLQILGDLLIVFDNYDIGRINKTSWIEAADVLSQATSYFYVMEWPGKTKSVYFYEVCMEVLDPSERSSFMTAMKNLLRLYLESNQFLLDTIIPSENLYKSKEENPVMKHENETGTLYFVSSLLNSEIIGNVTDAETLHNNSDIISERKTIGDGAGDSLVDSSIHSVNVTDVKSNSAESDSTESHSSRTSEDDKMRDMIQGDQEIEDNEEDYDYENDDPNYNHQDYEMVDESENGGDGGKTAEPLSEAEAGERLKRLLLDYINFFDFFKSDKDISSSHGNGAQRRRRRSIDGDTSSDEQRVGDKSINVFRSQDAKSMEEKKEDLRINNARDLVVEVPVNPSRALDFNHPRKQAIKITCDAIKILGKPAGLVLGKDDIASMTDTELEDCAEVLGDLDLGEELKRDVWKRMKEWKQSGNLLEVGNLVSAIEEHELGGIRLDLSKPWSYENLHALSKHISDPFLMSAASDEFLLQNTNLTTLTYEAATALGRLVCTMTLTHQKKLLLSQPDVFLNAVPILARTIECDNKIFESCIHQLAKISTSEEAFGKTKNWDANDVSTLGVIVAGLSKEDINGGEGNGLRPEALEGLTPSAMACMPSETLKVLTDEQVSHIPAMTAASLSETQMSNLPSSHFKRMNKLRRQMTNEELEESFNSGTGKLEIPFTIYLPVTIYITYNYLYSRTF